MSEFFTAAPAFFEAGTSLFGTPDVPSIPGSDTANGFIGPVTVSPGGLSITRDIDPTPNNPHSPLFQFSAGGGENTQERIISGVVVGVVTALIVGLLVRR